MKDTDKLDKLILASSVLSLLCAASTIPILRQAMQTSSSVEQTLQASYAASARVEELMKSALLSGEKPKEDELITISLEEQGFYRVDVPLSYELQDVLNTACVEFDVPLCLALAVMEQETRFQMLEGDGGESVGYFQIQARWWQWLMDEIGVTDLTDPAQNIRIGCAILGNLLDTYGNEMDALSAYNTGSPGTSRYAWEVLERMKKWRN